MAYCTQADIEKQLPEAVITALADDTLTGSADADVVAEAIAAAAAEIDAWAGGRYQVPFSPVPDVIRKVSVDIAIYNLFSRRDSDPPEVRKDRYKAAVKLLESIARGIVTIGAAEAEAPPAVSHAPLATGAGRIFSREKMEGF
jgi:phage gp36-like protein